jgi:endonuclease YncB( thermonuclease family)
MARYVALALALTVALVLVAVLIFAPVKNPLVVEKDILPKPTSGNADMQSVERSNAAKSLVGTGARDVGGGMVATIVAPGETLERIEAQTSPEPANPVFEPANPDFEPVALPDDQKRWRIVFNSVITAAGMFELNGMTIILPGIDIVSPDEKCSINNGREWPCGAAARTAFRAYVRNRAINCHLPIDRPDKAIVAECLLQGEDPAAWLVSQGWARAMENSPWEELETAARNAGLGIFGRPPAGAAINGGAAGNADPNSKIRPAPFQ